MSKVSYILITEGKTKHLLPVEDILHIEAVRVYSVFHTKNARQYVSSLHMGKVQKMIDPQQFLRVHKSHIVNLHEIKSYQNARGGKVILSNNSVIEVAQRRKTELLLHLAQLNKKSREPKKKMDPRILISNHTR